MDNQDEPATGHRRLAARRRRRAEGGEAERTSNKIGARIGVFVEDITIRVTRPGGAGLRHNDHHVKPSTKLKDGGSVMG